MILLPSSGWAPTRLPRRALALAVLLVLAPTLRATDAADDDAQAWPRKPRTLATVAVTADHPDAPYDPNLPTPVASIDAAQLDHLNVFNSEDALKYMPAFGIRKRFIGDENSTFSVRGTSNAQSARGLVFADGLLISNLLGNNWSDPPRWSMVFPDHLQRVDVLYGAYSALYPGNAIGATVLLTTRMPDRLELSAASQFYTQHVDDYGVDRSFGGQRYTASFGDRVGKLSFLLGVAHSNNNGQPLVYATQGLSATPAGGAATVVSGAIIDRGANGAPRAVVGINAEGQEATVIDQATLKLRYDFTPDWQGGLDVGYWSQQLSHRTASFLRDAQGNPVLAGTVAIGGVQYVLPSSYFAPSTRQSENYLYGVSLASHRDSGWNLALNASYFDLARNRGRAASSALDDDGPGQITLGDGSRWRTLDLRASYTPAMTDAGSHTVSLGYHYDGYRLVNAVDALSDWTTGSSGPAISATGGSTQTQALYLQDAWQLAERWQLTSGVRYERWRAFGGFIANGGAYAALSPREERHASPKLSLAYQASDAWRLRLSAARAYRFPTVGELFQGSFSGLTLVKNNPYLKPENDLSRELSAEWSGQRQQARFSLYRSDTRDTLFSQTDVTVFPNVTNVQNVSLVRTRGAEAVWQEQGLGLASLELSANAAYTQATTVRDAQFPAADGKQFYRVPRWRANLIATWHASEALALTLAGRYSGRQYNTLDHSDSNPNTFGGASAFLTWDATLNWRLDDHWDLSAGVDNLTDRRYYVYYPYPGRTLSMQAKVHL